MQPIVFTVIDDPKGQPRARAVVRKNGKADTYNPSDADRWKMRIETAAEQHIPATPIEGPVRVDAVFLFARPKRLLKDSAPAEPIPHTAKPDRDNLDKCVLDVLTRLGFWKDDAQVCAGEITKFYARKDGRPGAHITIRKIEQQTSASA